MMQERQSNYFPVFGFHSNLLPTPITFWTPLSELPPRDTEDGTVFPMLLPTAWMQQTSRPPVVCLTSRWTLGVGGIKDLEMG